MPTSPPYPSSSVALAHRVSDPRSYVRPVPLPIPPAQGLKMQARSDAFLNPTEPTRDVVRKSNYVRRREQLEGQGFQSRNDKPYKGIGDPFYLDQKQLILHALGQWDEKQHADWIHSSDSEDDDGDANMASQHKTAANFMLRRTRQDLNTLPKEVAYGREMIKGCRLGWGLFDMLQREKKRKADQKLREIRRQKEKLRTEWQPPKYDSSSECETDDDLAEDIDINQYMSPSTIDTSSLAPPPAPPTDSALPASPAPFDAAQQALVVAAQDQGEGEGGQEDHMEEEEGDGLKAKVAFTGVEPPAAAIIYPQPPEPSTRSSRVTGSSRPGSRHRSKLPPPRPFTPQHTSITTPTAADSTDKQAVFRQLCALYWLLEAMNIEPPQQMSPIATSWNLKEIGGTKTKDRKQEKEKLDTRWRQFTANQHLLKPGPSKKNAGGNSSSRVAMKSSRRYSGFPSARQGSMSSLTSLSGSINHLTQSQTSIQLGSQNTPGIRLSQAIPENGEIQSLSTEDMQHHTTDGILHSLDDYTTLRDDSDPTYPHPAPQSDKSSNVDRASNVDRSSNVDLASSKSEQRSEHSPSSLRRSRERFLGGGGAGGHHRRAGSAPPIPEYRHLTQVDRANILEKINKTDEDPRLQRLANPTEKRSSRTLRAEHNVRPMSSDAVRDFQGCLPSHKRTKMTMELRQSFAEVSEEKALELHDALETIERDRMRKITTKFSSLPMKGSFFRALKAMRSQTHVEEDRVSTKERNMRRESIHQQWYTDILNGIPEPIQDEWHFKKILSKLSKYGLVESSKQSAHKLLKVLIGLRDWEICGPDVSAAIEFCREKIVEISVEDYEDWFHVNFPAVVRPQTAPPAGKTEKTANDARGKGNLVPKSAPAAGRRVREF